MSLLSPPTYKQMAVTIVQSMLKAGTLVGSEAKVGMLFDFISPLVKDVPGALDHTDDEVSFTMWFSVCVMGVRPSSLHLTAKPCKIMQSWLKLKVCIWQRTRC